jgi:hypothetical protein
MHASLDASHSETLVEGVGGDRCCLCFWFFKEDRKLILHFLNVAPGHYLQLDGFVVLGELLLHLHLKLLTHLLCEHAQA